MPEDVRRDADVRRAREKAVDLLPARCERHRTVEDRDAARCRRFTSPASASTALRLNATTTVPSPERGRVRSPTHSGGSFRSKTFNSASGMPARRAGARRARRGGVPADSHPRGAAASRRSRAPRRRPCTSSMTRARPTAVPSRPCSRGSARSFTRSSPVIRPTFSSHSRAEPAVRLLASMRSGPAYARAVLGELLEGGVRLARVRRAEVGDDAVGRELARRQRDRDPRSARRTAWAGTACAVGVGRPRGGRRFRISARYPGDCPRRGLSPAL